MLSRGNARELDVDIWKFYAITHRDHLLSNPLSADKFDEIVRLLRLPEDARLLDIAAGKAEVTCRICEHHGASGVAVEISSYEIDAARRKLAERGLTERIELVHGPGADHEAEPASFDLTSCIGASWIWKGHEGTLRALMEWTKPDGLVLVGEPHALKEPEPEYLADEPEFVSGLVSFAENIRIGERLGLEFLYCVDSNRDEWDRYEFLLVQAVRRWAAEHPDDPDRDAILSRANADLERYLKWGRDTVGWAVYLFRKPASPA